MKLHPFTIARLCPAFARWAQRISLGTRRLQRPRLCRPLVESLEDRLPPGELFWGLSMLPVGALEALAAPERVSQESQPAELSQPSDLTVVPTPPAPVSDEIAPVAEGQQTARQTPANSVATEPLFDAQAVESLLPDPFGD